MNAIELADDLEQNGIGMVSKKLIIAELRRLHAENESLKLGMAKQANAVTLMRSVNADVAKTLAEQGVIVELSQLRSQLESEREANSQLTAEVEGLRFAKLPDGFELVAVKGLHGLTFSLNQANENGCLPFEIEQALESFEYKAIDATMGEGK